jgi:polyferredoxin
MRVEQLRRLTQLAFFILLVYGGFALSALFSIDAEAPPRGSEGEVNVFDVALPVRACRYIEPKPTLAGSCALKYLFDRPLYLPPWQPIAAYVLVIVSLCFVLGRFMCGWVCPLGFLSDMLDAARRRIGLERVALSPRAVGILSMWRYSFFLFLAFLAVAIAVPYFPGVYFNKEYYAALCQTCPTRMILPLLAGRIPVAPTFLTPVTAVFSAMSLLFLGVFASGLLVTRGWCRICPNGTFNSLFNRGCLIVKKKRVRRCTSCGICRRACPFNNESVCAEKEDALVNDPNCIMCFGCVEKCPEEGCLYVNFAGRRILSSGFRTQRWKG